MSYVCNMKSHIYPKTCYDDRNKHAKITALLSVCSEKLSIIGLSYYFGVAPHWNTECYSFGCLKLQWEWSYNRALLQLVGFGFRDKHSTSTLMSVGRGKYDARIYVVNKTVVY